MKIAAWLGVCSAWLLAGAAFADEPDAGASPEPAPGESARPIWPWPAAAGDPLPTGAWHAWTLAPSTDTLESAIVHLPPRAAGGAVSGTGRVARRLSERPVAIAGGRDRVFIVDELVRRAGELRRPVRALVATPTPAPGVWGYEPVGRFEVLPQLRRSAPVLGAGAIGETLVLLLNEDPPALVALSGGAWSELDAWPSGLDPAAAIRLRLIDGPGVIGLLAETGEGDRLAWRGTRGRGETIDWTPDPVEASVWGGAPDPFEHAVAMDTSGWVVLDGSGELHAIGEGYARRLGPVRTTDGSDDGARGVGWPGGLAVVGGPARAMVVRLDAGEGRSGRLLASETSLVTGRPMHEGLLMGGTPVTGQDVRLLMVVLVAVLLAVLLLIMRGGAESGVAELPDWAALAEPGRRVFGAMIDLVAAGMIAAWSTGSTLGDTVFLGGLGKPGGEGPILLMLAVGFVLGTAMEALTGRSLGKMLAGSAVVSVDRKGRRFGRPPGLVACGARNAVKWFAPPVAAMLIFDPNARHRGDVIARAAVVVAREPDPDPSPGDGPKEGK
ncbi:MAG: hypothetical protein EA378_09950 [Phycisphaerales bacterium]|nr:MAG: hypothetical protein EA378_09950 [Phycisphaerales bacterium]